MLQTLKKIFCIDIHTLPNGGNYTLPSKFWAFIWFFLRQIKWLLLLIGTLAALEAVMISLLYWLIGQLFEQTTFNFWLLMVGIGFMVGRVVFQETLRYCENILYTPYFGNMVRRQCFYYTANHSLAFFQNDFAGRIANKLLQCGPALRDATLSVVVALVFVGTMFLTNIILISNVSFILTIPLLIWLTGYVWAMVHFLPKIRDRSMITADSMSMLTGQIVDSFTNILAAKYFARTKNEDDRAQGFIEEHSTNIKKSHFYFICQTIFVGVLNTFLVCATMSMGYHMALVDKTIEMSTLAMALPMVIQTTFWSGWIMREMSGIFENLGTVQEGIETLSKPHGVTDKDNAKALDVIKDTAAISYSNVVFNYDRDHDQAGDKPVLEGFNLDIPAGQKVGLVGRSGAGKSTLTNLIVRAHDIESGAIAINGQNIADVTQDTLRRSITIVTQESYLFHRSITDNIGYGKPDATIEEIMEAAKQASAHDFILDLEDNRGRKGYEAHVGERGVKLSGGQKQRIGIARAILKDSPILILDEATSALDSESEAAIQDALEGIMEGKTVLAIAHRLSTLRQMDRIIVMDAGQIIEDGTHDELIRRKGGHYAHLWTMQSGGFLKET